MEKKKKRGEKWRKKEKEKGEKKEWKRKREKREKEIRKGKRKGKENDDQRACRHLLKSNSIGSLSELYII